MSDLVKLLRGEEPWICQVDSVAEVRCGRGDCKCIEAMRERAANEIERLREMLIEARDDATRFGRLMQKCVIALREIAEGDRPDNDEQFCVGYWGATARAALEGK
jgi:hypothetical protein